MFHVKPQDWWNQYHRLFRKIANTGSLSLTNIYEARLLLESHVVDRIRAAAAGDPDREASIDVAAERLKEVVDYGRTSFEAELARRKAQALLES